MGKTCLLKRFENKQFDEQQNATLGAQFVSLKIDVEYGTGTKALQYFEDEARHQEYAPRET